MSFEAVPEGPEKSKRKKLDIFESRYEKINNALDKASNISEHKEILQQLKAQEAAKELKKLKEEQEEEKVEEKLLNQLEFMHLKCPKCGGSTIKELANKDPKTIKLQCFDCKNIWELVR